MSSNPLHRAIYLTGATASGKSAVGVALARMLDAEILALDSMTLYRGMDIGTAKPTVAEREGVPHHLIDVLDPWESASVADYRALAIEKVFEIEGRGHRAIFVGGTPMYLKILLRGIFEGPPADAELRNRLELLTNETLLDRLHACDPKIAARLHLNDRRRLIRAIEVFELTGIPLSQHQQEHDRPVVGVPVFALERPRPELNARINTRVVAMYETGLVDEVRRLQSAPQPLSDVAAQGVGYKETIAHINGDISFDRMIELVQTRTRQFAKRQGTWFRGLTEVNPFVLSGDESPHQIAKRLATAIDDTTR